MCIMNIVCVRQRNMAFGERGREFVPMYTWLISNWPHFQLGSFLIGLNSNCIPS